MRVSRRGHANRHATVTVVIWCPFRYYVGVLNKKTMQMEVHSAQIFNLHPVIPGMKRRISPVAIPASVPSWLKRKQVLRF